MTAHLRLRPATFFLDRLQNLSARLRRKRRSQIDTVRAAVYSTLALEGLNRPLMAASSFSTSLCWRNEISFPVEYNGMPPHFFLSYARADSGPLVKKFFDDLCDYIYLLSGELRSAAVGFYEEHNYRPSSEWGESAVALQDSRTLVCLLSPAYFHSERTGKEWQFFEMRRLEALGKASLRGTVPTSLAQIVKPVVWTPWQGSVPAVINEILAHPDRLHQTQALTTMLKSSGKSRMEYREFAKVLASQIIELAENTSLPGLDSLPRIEEVLNPFHLWDEPATPLEQADGESDQRGRFLIEGEFTGKVTEQGHQAGLGGQNSAARLEAGSRSTNQTGELKPTSEEPAQPQDKYTAVIIDDNEAQVEFFTKEMLTDFEIMGDNTSKTVERILASPWPKDVPDLYVIDLDVKPEHTGLNLIRKLKRKEVTSLIVAKSERNGVLVEAIKAGAVAFLSTEAQRQQRDMMKQLAEYGRHRWLYRYDDNFQPDSTRSWRPIFLSYSGKDTSIATGLRHQIEALDIGVWYAAEDFQGGEQWRTTLEENIENVNIFLALYTENYLPSYGTLELAQFRLRMRAASRDKLFLAPVVHGEMNELKKQALFNDVLGECHVFNLTGDRFINGLRKLLRVLQSSPLIYKQSESDH